MEEKFFCNFFSRFWNFGAFFIVKQRFLQQTFLKRGWLGFAHIHSTGAPDLPRASRALRMDAHFRQGLPWKKVQCACVLPSPQITKETPKVQIWDWRERGGGRRQNNWSTTPLHFARFPNWPTSQPTYSLLPRAIARPWPWICSHKCLDAACQAYLRERVLHLVCWKILSRISNISFYSLGQGKMKSSSKPWTR